MQAGAEAEAGAEAAVSDDEREMVDFLAALLQLKEVVVPGGARGRIGTNVRGMFAEAQKVKRWPLERVDLFDACGRQRPICAVNAMQMGLRCRETSFHFLVCSLT